MSFVRGILAIFSCIGVFGTHANAADHLIPEASIFTTDYLAPTKSRYAERLGRMSGLDSFGNVFVAPSFENVFTVHLEETDDEYRLVCMELDKGLFAYQLLEEAKAGRFTFGSEEKTQKRIEELEAYLPDDLMDVEATVIEVPLSQELGASLKRVWGEMLYATRYPETDLTKENYASFSPGYDGTYYHFSFFHNHTPLSGWVWDYPPDGNVAKLVDIVNSAKSTCKDNDHDLDGLDEKVQRLKTAILNE